MRERAIRPIVLPFLVVAGVLQGGCEPERDVPRVEPGAERSLRGAAPGAIQEPHTIPNKDKRVIPKREGTTSVATKSGLKTSAKFSFSDWPLGGLSECAYLVRPIELSTPGQMASYRDKEYVDVILTVYSEDGGTEYQTAATIARGLVFRRKRWSRKHTKQTMLEATPSIWSHLEIAQRDGVLSLRRGRKQRRMDGPARVYQEPFRVTRRCYEIIGKTADSE